MLGIAGGEGRVSWPRLKGISQKASQGMQHLVSAHVGLLCPEASAGAVPRALIAGLEIAVDTESKPKAAVLDSLPVYLRAQLALYQVDNKAAKDASPQRCAFTYADLTHKDLLPVWMSS